MKSLDILYVNLGDNVPYTYDKIAGRILGWAKAGNRINLLVPELSRENIEKEILQKNPNTIRVTTLPFSDKKAISPINIVLSYLLRIIFSPVILFYKLPVFDIAVSNSAFLVDTYPILLLRLFGRCNHWVLIMDSVIPNPKERTGNSIVNTLSYYESLIVGKIANQNADIILTVNPELKREMVKRGISKNKIKYTQNGLFIENINPILSTEKYEYDGVYQGRISPNKGVLDLIKVWSKVIVKIPHAKLAIMGTGMKNNIAELEKMIDTHNLKNNIAYLGFTGSPKKYQIMKSSKVFLYLSKVNADESWGISLMEALACGLPAITYDLAIYKHIYDTDGVTSLQNGDINTVADVTIDLINNPRRRAILSIKAIDFASKFDWNNIAKRDLILLNAIMKDENNHQN